MRELIRRDQEAQAAKRLRELIEEGLNAGPAPPLNDNDWARLRKAALERKR